MSAIKLYDFHAVCKKRGETKKEKPRLRNGITFIEIIIVVGLIALISTVIAPMFTAVNRAWDKDKRLKEQIQRGRDAMDFMIYEIKKSNGVIDGTSADFSTTSALDAGYVVFSSAGDEIVLDDKNSGYKSSGTINSVTGSGFANDYDATAAGYATYDFKTVMPGLYDLQSYFISTATANALVGVFDDTCYDTIVADISSTFSQGTATAGTWYAVNCSDASFCTNKYGGAVRSLNLTAGGGTGGDCIGIKRASGASNVIMDAFRLVYRGIRHKVFACYSEDGIQCKGNTITYGDDDVDNDGSDGNDALDSLVNNNVLIDNVSLIPGTPFLQYFQADGVTAATSAKDVALIKIAFQLNDPEGKLPPYPLRAQVMLTQDPSSKRLVINEIFKEELVTEIAEERFDGNSNGDGDNGLGNNAPYVAGQTDGGWYGFATNVDDIDGDGDNDLDMDGNGIMDDDAWLSVTESFSAEMAQFATMGWEPNDCADAGEFCNVGLDGDNALFTTSTIAEAIPDDTGMYFFENSRNYVAVVDFKVPCNERQTFGFDMRFVDNGNANGDDYVRVDFYVDNGNNAACVRVRRAMDTGAGTNSDNYPAAAGECGAGGIKVAELDDNLIENDASVAAKIDIYDDAQWHRLVVQDVYYTASVWLSEGAATKDALNALAPGDYRKILDSVNYDPAADRFDAYDVTTVCGDTTTGADNGGTGVCVGVKGFHVFDDLNGTATDDFACPLGAVDDPAQVRWDNILIWSLDWKPTIYQTNFDDVNTVWATNANFVRASVDAAFGPLGDHTTGVGGTGKAMTTAGHRRRQRRKRKL